jgi:hypothetical protein
LRSPSHEPNLSDNQIGDRLHAALEAIGTDEGETIRRNTALVAARQTLSFLEENGHCKGVKLTVLGFAP